MENWITHIIIFIVGIVIGAAVNRLAAKYADERQGEKERKKDEELTRKIVRTMPKLIKEMKEDIKDHRNLDVREMVILQNERVGFNTGGKKRFVYYEENHSDLKGKISFLKEKELLSEITSGNAPIYKISDKFWNIIRTL